MDNSSRYVSIAHKVTSYFLILINLLAFLYLARIFLGSIGETGLGGLGIIYALLRLPFNLIFFIGAFLFLKKKTVGWFLAFFNAIIILLTAYLAKPSEGFGFLFQAFKLFDPYYYFFYFINFLSPICILFSILSLSFILFIGRKYTITEYKKFFVYLLVILSLVSLLTGGGLLSHLLISIFFVPLKFITSIQLPSWTFSIPGLAGLVVSLLSLSKESNKLLYRLTIFSLVFLTLDLIFRIWLHYG